MAIANNDRIITTLLREICSERGISVTSFSNDWILRLESGTRTSCVFGYDFDLNSAPAQMIGKDKAAASEILTRAGIPVVEHRGFHRPRRAPDTPFKGNWDSMLQYFYEHSEDVVCKPNEGTGGRDVSRAQTVQELEAAVHRIFSETQSLCLSPFLPITGEYRVYVLRGAGYFAYSKDRASVVGDGYSTLSELILADVGARAALFARLNGSAEERAKDINLSSIPAEGEIVLLNWRHNLGQGARPCLIAQDDTRLPQLADLALSAMRTLRIELAAVDLAEVSDRLLVLEVNCGIMMESFATSSVENRACAKRFYENIVEAALGINMDTENGNRSQFVPDVPARSTFR